MAVFRKPYKNLKGEIEEDKEVVYSDLGLSLILLPEGIIYPCVVINKAGPNKYYIEFTDEAGYIPEELYEEEIEVI